MTFLRKLECLTQSWGTTSPEKDGFKLLKKKEGKNAIYLTVTWTVMANRKQIPGHILKLFLLPLEIPL